MDVAAIAIGTDFVDQVEQAIATSDASLVVIGPQWLRTADAEGRQRLDDPEDHVRAEVRSALASAKPVVPVLVGGASLPSEPDLPDDLRSLVRRQAIELNDQTWAEDVEMLIRRLEGKETVRAPRRMFLPVAIGLVILGVAGVVLWQTLRDSGGNGDITGCPGPDDPWTMIDVAADATAVEQLSGGRALRYQVEGTDFREESGEWIVVLHVRLQNESQDVPGNDDHTGFGPGNFDALLVDQVSAGEPECFDYESGDTILAPGEAAIARVGFISSLDPSEASLMLETDGPLLIQITPGV
jgi:TIR domain